MILINALLLYVVNNLIAWEAQVIRADEFRTVLPYVNASLVAQIIGNALFIFLGGQRSRQAVHFVLGLVSLAATWMLFRVFPFDFAHFFQSPWLTPYVKAAFGIGLIALVVSIVVRVIRLVRPS